MPKREDFEVWLLRKHRELANELYEVRAHRRDVEAKEERLATKLEGIEALCDQWDWEIKKEAARSEAS